MAKATDGRKTKPAKSDRAQKKREMRQFDMMQEQPTQLFERVLHGGTITLAHAPHQLRPAIEHALRELHLPTNTAAGLTMEIRARDEQGEFRVSVEWFGSASRFGKLGFREKQLLALDLLLQHVEETGWNNLGKSMRLQNCFYPAINPDGSLTFHPANPQPDDRARAAYRTGLYQEFLRLFFDAFVKPELRAQGASDSHKNANPGKTDAIAAAGEKLRDAGETLARTKEVLAERFGVTKEWVGKVLAKKLNWTGRASKRGRKPKIGTSR